MKVLVTGGNGFLGNHVVRMLLEQKYDVRAFVLDGTSTTVLEGLDCDIYVGNLLEQKDIEEALDSCDYVIHTAALTDMWPSRNKQSWRINVDIVKLLVAAIKQSSIKRYIHVGTANSFGFGTFEEPGTEECAYSCDIYGLDYMDSKKEAQDYVLSEYKETNLPVIVLNPTFMIGAYDEKPGTGEMILSVIHQKVPGYAAGGRCFAAVKDVALACVNALTMGRLGQCYITGGTNLCYKDFFSQVAHIAQVKAPKRKIPTWIAVLFAGMIEFFAALRHKKPLLTKTMARMSKDGHYYSSNKAEKELKYTKSDLHTAIQEAIQWYDLNGYIKQR